MKPETPISQLSLPPREHRALLALDINTVGEFLSADLQRVLEVPTIGYGTLVRLIRVRKELGGSDKKGEGGNAQTSNPDWQSVLGRLSVRTQNGLRNLGIDSFDKLLAIREEEFLSCRGIGRTCWDEVARHQKRFEYWVPASVARLEPLQQIREMLGTNAVRILDTFNVQTLADLFRLSREEVTSSTAFGPTAWREVQDAIKRARVPIEAAFPTSVSKLPLGDFPLFGRVFTVGQLDLSDHFFPHVPTEELSLPARCQSILSALNIHTLRELLCIPAEKLLRQPNFGETSLKALQRSVWTYMESRSSSHMDNDLSLDDLPLFGRTIMEDEIDLPDHFFPHVPTEELSLPARCQSILSALNIHTLRELLCIPAEKLLRQPNFGETSLKILQESVRKHMEFRNSSHADPVHPKSFSDMISQLSSMVGVSSEKQKILANKLGICGYNPETLDAIGQRFDYSKERTRQMLKEICRTISQDHQTRPILDGFRESIKDSLDHAGGILWLDELAEQISQSHYWESVPTPANLKEFFRLFRLPGISLRPQQVTLDHPCRKCESIPDRFNKFMRRRSSALPLGSKMTPESLCGGARGDTCPMVQVFSDAFLQELAGRANLPFDDAAIYSQDLWDLEYGGLNRKVEIALKQIGRVAQPKEVWEALYPYMEDFAPLERIHSALIGAANVYVWGRGEFIHLDHIHIQEDELTSLRTILAARLQQTPFLALVGIFREHHMALQNAGIPNEYALASIVRLHLANDFHCDRYRYVRSESQSKTTSIDSAIEEWVLEQGGRVNRRDLAGWFVDTIGVRPSLITLALSRLPNIVAAGRGKLIHIDNTGLDAERLHPLQEHVTHALRTYDHISVGKLYNEKRVTCLDLQIRSQSMLYGVMRHFFSNEFDFLRPPHICRHEQESFTTINQAIEQYTREKAAVIVASELANDFGAQGYDPEKIRTRLTGFPNIFRYHPGCIVHADTIDWTGDKAQELRSLLEETWQKRKTQGHFTGDLQEVLDQNEDRLPPLRNGSPWTIHLLASTAGQLEGLHFLGNARRAYCLQSNPQDSDMLASLVVKVLKEIFGGGCSREQMNSWMRDNGVVLKQLTSSMFSPPPNMAVTDHEYILTEGSNA